MNSLNFGNSQNYPVYPNCFDMLAIHGVVGEDPMAYMTGTPSPYLQNYVAQRGAVPSLPGQLMPDNLPGLPQNNFLPQDNFQNMTNVQNSDNTGIPQKSDLTPKLFQQNKSWDKAKKIGAAILLSGLITLGVIKGKNALSKLFKKASPKKITPKK